MHEQRSGLLEYVYVLGLVQSVDVLVEDNHAVADCDFVYWVKMFVALSADDEANRCFCQQLVEVAQSVQHWDLGREENISLDLFVASDNGQFVVRVGLRVDMCQLITIGQDVLQQF